MPDLRVKKSPSEWISMQEAARHAPYSQEYLSLLARRGKFFAKKIGRNWYTTHEAVAAYVKEQAELATSLKYSPILAEAPAANLQNQPENLIDEFRRLNPQAFAQPQKQEQVSATPQNELKSSIFVPELKPEPKPEQEIIGRLDRLSSSLENFADKLSQTALRPNSNGAGRPPFFKFKNQPPKKLLAMAIAAISLIFILVGGFSFGQADAVVQSIKKAFTDATSLEGHFPGTHANEVLVLDKAGNIDIYGHIETQGQFRSYAPDGVAPIVVDSTTQVDNLNANYLQGLEGKDFTLAFVTKNGNLTYEDVNLEGNVEVGKTLLVKGAMKLLDSLQVDGTLGVFSDAVFGKDVTLSNGDLNITKGTIHLTNQSLVKNLNAEFLNGTPSSGINLQFVTSNGATTTNAINVGGITSTGPGFFNGGVWGSTGSFGTVGADTISANKGLTVGDSKNPSAGQFQVYSSQFTVDSNGNTTAAGTLTGQNLIVSNAVESNLIPSGSFSLGSATNPWSSLYAINGTFSGNLVVSGSLDIAGTSSTSFVINTQNASADTIDSYLAFDRGTVKPNATLKWNSTLKQFEFNEPLAVASGSFSVAGNSFLNGTASVSSNFEVGGTASIGSNILTKGILNSSGTGSNSFAGSLDITKGLRAAQITGSGLNISGLTNLGSLIVSGQSSFNNASASGVFEVPTLKTDSISNSTGTLQINAFTLGGLVTGNNQNILGLNQLTSNIASISSNFEVGGYASIGGNLFVNGSTSIFSASTSGNFQVGGIIKASDGTAAVPSYTFTNDTNTGLFRIGNDNIGVTTGGVQRLGISSTGASLSVPFEIQGTTSVSGNAYFGSNVGIGTPNPSDKLQVSAGNIGIDANQRLNLNEGTGTAYIIRQTSAPAGVFVYSDGNQPAQFSNGGLSLGSYSTTNQPPSNGLIVSGNVGIGKTNPATTFDVHGTASASAYVGTGIIALTGTGSNSFAGSLDVTKGLRAANFTQVGTANNYFNGNVGIGTTSPAKKLQVNDSLSGNLVYPLLLKNIQSANNTAVGLGFNTDSAGFDQIKGGIAFVRTGSFGTGNLLFLNNVTGDASSATTADAKLTISSAGNISTPDNLTVSGTGTSYFTGTLGVGITTSGGRLTVGNSASDGGQTIANSGILFANTGGWSSAAIYVNGTTGGNGDLIFGTDGDGVANSNVTEKMRILANGNVGIGSTAPGQKLVVVGTTGNNDLLNVASSSGTSILYVTKGGNVGIGTSNPAALEEIQSNNTGYKSYLRLSSTGNSGGTQNGIEWYNTVAGTVSGAIYTQPGGGFTNPSFAIDVGGVGQRVVDIGKSTFDIGWGGSLQSQTFSIKGISTTADILNVASSSGTSILYVAKNGDVGIGSTSPQRPLDVEGTVRVQAIIEGASNPTTNFLNLQSSGNAQLAGTSGVVLDINGGNLLVRSNPSQTTRFDINSSGNVGIKTTNLVDDFNLNGTASISGNLFLGGFQQVSGVTSSSFAGLLELTGIPAGTGVSQGSLYINPKTSGVNNTLFGAAVGGTQEAKLDASGNLTVNGFYTATSTTGTSALNGNLTVGHNTTFGSTGSDSVNFNARVNTDVIPAIDNTYNLGSPNHRWANFYAENAVFTTNTNLPGVSSASFTIFTSNTTNDASSSYLAFHRGTASPDAKLTWDATNKEFNFNFPVSLNGSVIGQGTTSSSFAGPVWFTGTPTGTAISNGTVYINPSTAGSGYTLFGIAVNGVQKFKVDANGDITGYSGLTVTNGETIQGTTGLLLSGANSPIDFSGSGTHEVKSSGGTLQLDAFQLGGAVTGNNQSITGLDHIAARTASLSVGLEITGSGTASISGATTLGSTLSVGGNSTLTGTLTGNSTGSNSFAGSLDLSKGFAFPNGKITASGNVGIGTTTPTQLLQIGDTSNGNLKFQQSGGVSSGEIQEFYQTETTPRFAIGRDLLGSALSGIAFNTSGGSTIAANGVAVGIAAGRVLGFYTSNGTALTERARIDSSGNFGIGKTNPLTTLDVHGTASVSGNVYLALGSGSTVGIGTNSPSSTLDIRGTFDAGTNGTQFTVNGSGTVNTASSITAQSWIQSADIDLGSDGNASVRAKNNKDLIFETGTSTERMRILQSNGDVGIGTSVPGSLLDVKGAISAGTGSAAAPGLTFEGDLNTGLFDKGGADSLSLVTGGVEQLNVTSTTASISNTFYIKSGNVGIGTTNPTTKFQVVGNASVSANFEVGGTASIGGNVTSTGSVTAASFIPTGTTIPVRGLFSTDGSNYTSFAASSKDLLDLYGPSPQAILSGTLRVRGSAGTTDANGLLQIENTGTAVYSILNFVNGSSATTVASLTGYGTSSTGLGAGNIFYNAGLHDFQTGNVQVDAGSLTVTGKAGNNIIANFASASGTSALYINKSGNVGIGTTGTNIITPFQVHVASNNNIFVRLNSDPEIIGGNDNLTSVVSFRIQGAPLLLNPTSNGLVGIGTTTPTATYGLTVASSSAGIAIKSTTSTASASLAFLPANAATNNKFTIRAGGSTGSGGQRLEFLNGANTSLMTIASSGFIGINTTTPAALLDVAGANAKPGSDTPVIRLTFNGGNYGGIGRGATNDSLQFISEGNSSNLELNATNSSTGNIYLIPKSSAGIVITQGSLTDNSTGSVSFSGSLDVTKGLRTTGVFKANNTSNGNIIGQLQIDYGGSPALSQVGGGKVSFGSPININPGVSPGVESDPSNTNGLVLAAARGGNSNIIFETSPVSDSTFVERMRIATNGNVGIGSSNPSQNLVVTAAAGSTTDLFNVASASGTSALYVNKSNLVGVDTNSPNREGQNASNIAGLTLEAKNASGGSTIELLSPGTLAGNEIGRIAWGRTSSYGGSITARALITAQSDDGSASSSLHFYTQRNSSGGPTERLTIDSSGNVGIGTTNPISKLEVNGVISVDGSGQLLSFNNIGTNYGAFHIGSTGTDAYFGQESSSGGALITGTLGYATIIGNRDNKPIQFFQGNSVIPLTIASGGNVGIGTTNPGYKLYVASNTSVDSIINQVSANSSALAALRLRGSRGSVSSPSDVQNGDQVGAFLAEAYSGGSWLGGGEIDASIDGTFTSGQRPPSRLTFLTNTAGGTQTERVRIDSAGNVGIGTTSPGSTLDVRNTSGSALTVSNTSKISTAGSPPLVNVAADGYSTASGTFRFEDFRTPQSQPSFVFNVASKSATNTVAAYDFQTGKISRLSINQSGNVGIGTTNPAYGTLEVAQPSSSNRNTVSLLATAASGNGSQPALTWLNNSGNAKWSAYLNVNDGNLDIFDEANSVTSLTFKPGGNVGIGTTNPGVPVDIVTGSANYQAARVRGSGAGLSLGYDGSGNGLLGDTAYGGIITLTAGGNAGIGATPSQRLVVQGIAGNNDILNIASASGTSILYVAKNSDVGIGTTSPAAMLEIYNTNGSSDQIHLNSTDTTSGRFSGYAFYSGTNFKGGIFRNQKNDNVGIFTSGNGSTPMVQIASQSGDFSVGSAFTIKSTSDNTSTDPGTPFLRSDGNYIVFDARSGSNIYLNWDTQNLVLTGGDLEVGTGGQNTIHSGELADTTDIGANVGDASHRWGCIYLNGSTVGACTSDQRLKKDISPLTFSNPLDQISGIQLDSYHFNNQPASSSFTNGVIAQQVLTVAPELVSVIATGSNAGYYQVDYGKLNFLNMAAIQALANRFGTITANAEAGTTLTPGDVVALTASASTFRLASNAGEAVGVVNMNDITTGKPHIQYSGAALLKVSTENGPIQPGDKLTLSATQPGVAVKATQAGPIIGFALDSLSSVTSGSYATIQGYINPSYWSPSVASVASGSATTITTITASGSYSNILVSSTGTFNGLASQSIATINTVLAKVSDLWSAGDIIAEGLRKTYFAAADTLTGFTTDVSNFAANWSSRTITIANNADDATKALFTGNAAQAADQSKLGLEQNGDYLATYGVDSTRGEIQLSGSSQLVNGEANVFFDYSFSSVISPNVPIRVILTPTTGTIGQMYVAQKTQFGFVVKELNGSDDATFDWLVIARRKGYDTDVTPTPTPLTSSTTTTTASSSTQTVASPTPTPTLTSSSTTTTTASSSTTTVSPTPTPTLTSSSTTTTTASSSTTTVSPSPSPTASATTATPTPTLTSSSTTTTTASTSASPTPTP